MKTRFKLTTFLIICILLSGCPGEDEVTDNNPENTKYRQEMHDFVINISTYAKNINTNFLVIPQNGQELVTHDGNENGSPVTAYLNAIDGAGREDLFYGYNNDNVATPSEEVEYMITFLNVCKANQVVVLTTDYCWDYSKMDDSYRKNNSHGFISFAAPERELNTIPDYPEQPYQVNSNDVNNLSDIKNFLYLLNTEKYSTKESYLTHLEHTNYDLLLVDCYYEDQELTQADVLRLKEKDNGGERLVISYLSIGEAEDYRFYWMADWKAGNPEFIVAENPDWEGNYKVQYWNTNWQSIIFGNQEAYLDKILTAGFDGVYLDIIDAFEYFE